MAETSKPIVLFDPHPRRTKQIFSDSAKQRLESLCNVIWHDGSPAGLDHIERFLPTATFLVGQTPLSKERLDRAPHLKGVFNVESNFLPNVDYQECHRRGIHVLSTAPVFSRPVAEMALGVAISLARRIHQADAAIRSGTETLYGDQALVMVIVAIPSCIVSGMAQTAFTIAFRSALPIQSEFHFVHVSVLDVLYERTGLLFGWSSLYFGIRHALQGMQRKLDLAFAKTAQSDAEIRMLRSLFNAHFLLNSLNTVMNTLERQRPGAREMVQALSDHLNYSLRHRSDDLVLLGEEIAALESYLVLERARLGSELDFAHKIEGQTRFARVPGFILQPLVENAIKYGRKTFPGKVLVRLIVQQEENTIVIQVFNTGRWIDPDPERKSGGVGLEAIKGKLLWLYPNQHSISSFEEEGWVTVQVKVPFAS